MMEHETLLYLLLDAGLLQFGYFHTENGPKSYQIQLEMLPSYPMILQTICDEAARILPDAVDYLLATPEAVALGGALSQHLTLPLVYSRGSDDLPVQDLIGAYDIGHPACLLVNTSDDLEMISRITDYGERTGLIMSWQLVILETRPLARGPQQPLSLLSLGQAVGYLGEQGRLPQHQVAIVQQQLMPPSD